MADLFDEKFKGARPLAERMRPKVFSDFFGQEEIVGKGKPLRVAIEKGELQSVILWGPPGSGKTTLARIVAEKSDSFFETFSAATSGIPELRKKIEEAKSRFKNYGQRTILFIDEIHHFNKSQQVAFLPHVEDGTIILIGATTENPSFELVSPLLSRSIVLVLKPLSFKDIKTIVKKALEDKIHGYGEKGISLTEDALEKIAVFADGDARVSLNTLEFAVMNIEKKRSGKTIIDGKKIEEILQKKTIRYDKAGEEHYNIISAFIKSMRDSDPDGALYWLARMLEGGETPRFIARRMLIFASEDIGNALPTALVVASSVANAVEHVGMPEAAINLAQGATYLASAPKDNASYKGLMEASEDAKKYGALPVPLHLRNAVTNLMKEMGYAKGYKYAHDFPAGGGKNTKILQEHMPEKLKGKKYYRPKKK